MMFALIAHARAASLDERRCLRTQCAPFPILIHPLMATPAQKKLLEPTIWHEVRTSSIHSRGVFARIDIPKDTKILEYTGEKISKAESERRARVQLERAKKNGEAAVYIFNLNKRQDLDGGIESNIARLLNHSCDPNCEAIQSRGRIWMTAVRDIKQGEELTFNYGFDLENWEDHPCLCGKNRCVGYIVDEQLWPGLLERLQKRGDEVRALRNGATNGQANGYSNGHANGH